MPIADWYSDFISPYRHLQLTRFDALPDDFEVRIRTLPFAALPGPWSDQRPARVGIAAAASQPVQGQGKTQR